MAAQSRRLRQSSPSPLVIGLIISGVIVIGFGILLAFLLTGGGGEPLDQPTDISSDQNLRKLTLPTDLPAVFQPSSPDEDAAAFYEQAVNLYMEYRLELIRKTDPEKVKEFTTLLIRAMNAGKIREGFLDDHYPLQPAASSEWEEPLVWIKDNVFQHVLTQTDKDEKLDPQSLDTVRAVWALGERSFRQNLRYFDRLLGLRTMHNVASSLQFRHIDTLPVAAWMAPLEEIDQAWTNKIHALWKLADFNSADAIRIAKFDQDLMFRVEATLRLGYMKKRARGEANRQRILATIAELKKDPEPIIAQAAAAAESWSP